MVSIGKIKIPKLNLPTPSMPALSSALPKLPGFSGGISGGAGGGGISGALPGLSSLPNPLQGMGAKSAIKMPWDNYPQKNMPLENMQRPDRISYTGIDSLGDSAFINPMSVKAQTDPSSWQGISAAQAVVNGNSPWLQMAKSQQGLEEQNQLDNAAKSAATSAATARSNLAMRGGLRTGAAERLASQAADSDLLARQGVRNQGALTRAGLDVQNEQNRQQMIGTLGGMELGKNNYITGNDQYNATNTMNANEYNAKAKLTDLLGRNSFNSNMYNADMGEWGASKQADAMLKAQNQGNRSAWQMLNDPLGIFGGLAGQTPWTQGRG